MSEVETFISSKDYEAIRKRAETAEAILADVLADVNGVDQPQLSIGRQVWWVVVDLWRAEVHHMMSGRLSSVGREWCSVWRTYPSNHVLDFVPTKDLFFSEEAARKAE